MRPQTSPKAARRRTIVMIAGAAIALVAGLVPAVPASAVTMTAIVFHVDCSRPTNGDGSLSKPWNSVGAVNRHADFKPGDQILLKRGRSCTGRLHPKGSGSASAPIVLGAYGSSTSLPTVNGGGTPDQTGTVQLINQPYWTIQDLHLTNHGTAKEVTQYRSGVLIRGFNGRIPGVVIQRLRIDSVVSNLSHSKNDPREFGGISVQTLSDGKPGSGFDGLQIRNNRITKVGRTGIMVSNHGYPKTSDTLLRITGNTITRARGDSIVIRGSVGARIDQNVSAYGADLWPCKQCGAITPDTANAGIWPAYSRGTRIDHNEVFGEHALGGDGEGIDVDMSAVNTTVEYNYIHDNQGGGILFCGSNATIARFNIFQNNKQGQITFIGSIPAKNTTIYNNTIYSKVGNKALAVRTFGGLHGKNVKFFNNLFYNLDDSGYFVWPTKPKARTNTYVGVHGIGEPVDVRKGYFNPGLRAPGTGRNGFNTLAGYKVTPNQYTMTGSPIPKSVTKDFFGKTINPAKPPRGAAG